ncbi:MAG TPA: GNAT family N-acetyltransferase, partial [Alphaproteobacteria bacterium]|nr:GNAT family N-acetyltransferase [Alphaproteobacteria bacterium]
GDELAGLVALKYHFGSTTELWWLGLKPEFHRRGIGTSLVNVATMRARERGCEHLAVMTISEWSDDEFYRRTRLFYQRLGFQPFVEFNETDPLNPMMWMIKPL